MTIYGGRARGGREQACQDGPMAIQIRQSVKVALVKTGQQFKQDLYVVQLSWLIKWVNDYIINQIVLLKLSN